MMNDFFLSQVLKRTHLSVSWDLTCSNAIAWKLTSTSCSLLYTCCLGVNTISGQTLRKRILSAFCPCDLWTCKDLLKLRASLMLESKPSPEAECVFFLWPRPQNTSHVFCALASYTSIHIQCWVSFRKWETVLLYPGPHP